MMAEKIPSAIGAELRARFQQVFDGVPCLFRAPGRINLLGEHTDYNDGFVLPAALELAVWTAIAPRADRRLRVRSLAMDSMTEFDLDDFAPSPDGNWSDYVHGVAIMLKRAGHQLVGADLMIDGDLPMGAGLSASAALEVSVGYALLAVSGLDVDRIDLAKICHRAENDFVGARCGIMDQFISCCAIKGAALLLDCRSLEFRAITIDQNARLMVCDTMVRHELASSEYNLRRAECERAVALLSKQLNHATALRDVTAEQLSHHAALLPETLFRRARHVVSENARTLRAAAALEAGDLSECGRMMDSSHASLRDDYEVSCPELNLMVELTHGLPGVYGSKMMGGGFGGSTINLVDAQRVDRFIETVAKGYKNATGVTPSIFCCVPGPGAGPVCS
jgi:galactokinase